MSGGVKPLAFATGVAFMSSYSFMHRETNRMERKKQTFTALSSVAGRHSIMAIKSDCVCTHMSVRVCLSVRVCVRMRERVSLCVYTLKHAIRFQMNAAMWTYATLHIFSFSPFDYFLELAQPSALMQSNNDVIYR